MGMKISSAHFPINGSAGGPSKRVGYPFALNLQLFAKMPKKRSQIMHIMRNDDGHLSDSPRNRSVLVDLTSHPEYYVGIDKHGNSVYSRVDGGFQYWAYVRNDVIQNGGVNRPGRHRNFQREIKGKGEKK